MPFVHGSKAVLKIGDSTNTLVDLTQKVKSVSFPREVETHETTTLGATAKTYEVGLQDATISIEGFWDTTVDALMDGIRGLSGRNFEYGPAGSTIGNPRYTGTCILTSYEVSAAVDDMLTFSAEFQVSGPVTRGTY